MGTCSETIYKHQILFPSIHHLAWLPQGRPQGNKKVVKIAIFGLTHWLKHRITRILLRIDEYMLRGVWQALNCLSIHAIYCVILAGASPVGKNVGWGTWKRRFFCTCGSNNWETVEDTWVHAATQFVSIEFSFHPCNILGDNHRGVSRRNKNVGCGT